MNESLEHISSNVALMPWVFTLSILPFFTFAFLMLFGRKVSRYRGILATSIMFICTIIASVIFYKVSTAGSINLYVPWFTLGKSNIGIDFDIKVTSTQSKNFP